MKVFFHVFLYLNTGLCALFFVAWLLTSVPVFQSSAVAQQSAGNTFARVDEMAGSAPVPDGLDKKAGDNNVERKRASASEPLSDSKTDVLPTTGEINSPLPPLPSPVDSNTESVPSDEGAPGAIAPAEAGEADSIPPPPEIDNMDNMSNMNDDDTAGVSSGIETEKEGDSSPLPVGTPPPDLDSLLESARQLKDQQGTSADAAHDLMNINQKVVEIYKMLSNYEYDSNNRRNPFTPFKSELEAEESSRVSPTYNYPTGKFALGEMDLIGVKWNSKLGPSEAMFKTPDGVIHYLQVNHWIGNNRGIIYEIRENEVVILEPKLETGTTSMSEDSYVPVIITLERLTKKGASDSTSVVAQPVLQPAAQPPPASVPQK